MAKQGSRRPQSHLRLEKPRGRADRVGSMRLAKGNPAVTASLSAAGGKFARAQGTFKVPTFVADTKEAIKTAVAKGKKTLTDFMRGK